MMGKGLVPVLLLATIALSTSKYISIFLGDPLDFDDIGSTDNYPTKKNDDQNFENQEESDANKLDPKTWRTENEINMGEKEVIDDSAQLSSDSAEMKIKKLFGAFSRLKLLRMKPVRNRSLNALYSLPGPEGGGITLNSDNRNPRRSPGGPLRWG